METPISSAPGDANSPRASFAGGGPSEGNGSTANGRSYYDKFGYPDAASHFEAKDQVSRFFVLMRNKWIDFWL
jgi:hypothetical protein